MRKLLSILACLLLSLCSVQAQSPAEILSRAGLRGASQTGGTTNKVRFVPLLDTNGALDVSFMGPVFSSLAASGSVAYANTSLNTTGSVAYANTSLNTTGSVVIANQLNTHSNRFYGWWTFDTISATTGIFTTVSNTWLVTSNASMNSLSATNIYSATNWSDLFIGALQGNADTATWASWANNASNLLGIVTGTVITNAGSGLVVSGAHELAVDWAMNILTNDARYVTQSALGLSNYWGGATVSNFFFSTALPSAVTATVWTASGDYITGVQSTNLVGGYLSTNGGTVNGVVSFLGRSNIFNITPTVLLMQSNNTGQTLNGSAGGVLMAVTGASNRLVWFADGALGFVGNNSANQYAFMQSGRWRVGIQDTISQLNNSGTTTLSGLNLFTGTNHLQNASYSTSTGTTPSNLVTFALGDARYLGVSGTSNGMVWTSLPYNGSWQTQAVAVTGLTSTNSIYANVFPDDPGAVYLASYLAPNKANITRLATSTLNGYTGSVTVSSQTPLLTSSGLVAAASGSATDLAVSNLSVTGALTINGVSNAPPPARYLYFPLYFRNKNAVLGNGSNSFIQTWTEYGGGYPHIIPSNFVWVLKVVIQNNTASTALGTSNFNLGMRVWMSNTNVPSASQVNTVALPGATAMWTNNIVLWSPKITILRGSSSGAFQLETTNAFPIDPAWTNDLYTVGNWSINGFYMMNNTGTNIMVANGNNPPASGYVILSTTNY